MRALTVRRVRAEEWRAVRELRLQALQDADAVVAFLDTYEHAADQPDVFWKARTERAANGDDAAQFVAVDGTAWIGCVTVLRRPAGDVDHLGRTHDAPRADIVGVYVAPAHRGRGTIDALLSAAAEWAGALGDAALTLDVHADNARAQGAYRRSGFEPTGIRFTGPIGPELEMSRPL